MSEIRATTISDETGNGPIALTKQSAAKAFINLNGTGTIAARDSLNISSTTDFTAVDLSTAVGGGRYKGERGTNGPAAAAGDIFRVHEQQLDTNTTIASGDNAGAFFSLTVATGVTLTVNGNLVIA